MSLQLLLLLILLSPGNSLQLWDTWEDEAKGASGPLLARGRRQVSVQDNFDTYDGYDNTDPPEMLENDTGAVTSSPSTSLWTVMGTLGQRDPADLDARGATTENLSMELATEGSPITPDTLPIALAPLITPISEAPSTEGAQSTELATVKSPSMGPVTTEALSMQRAATEALSTRPAAMEALTTQPAATEAPPTRPAVTEALTTQPAATEAPPTRPAATEALTTQPAATEVLSTRPAAMEMLTTQPTATKGLSTEPAATLALSMKPTTTETMYKDPATAKAPPTQPATTWGLTTALLVHSDPSHRSTTMAVSNSSDSFVPQWRNSQGLSPQSSVAPAPTPTRGLDYIPVKHCLLAIFILALVATTFLVCTVVLAVRLSRKNHMYPVRNYSPTEMVCISSLLPEGGEGPTVTANGSLPAARKPDLKEVSREDRDGDDLTLRSFLP